MDSGRGQGLDAETVHVGHRRREVQETDACLTSTEQMDGGGVPSLHELKRAICCPTGACSTPEDCYSLRRDRDVPVRIERAALAVLKLLTRGQSLQKGITQAPTVTVVPLTTQQPGVFTIDYEVGVPQDSAWQPLPDRSPSDR